MELISEMLGLGLGAEDLGVWQMLARACVIYFFTWALLKAGKKRFMGQYTALDVVLMIVLGSVASRAINGSAPFFPTLAACVALVLIHRLMSRIISRDPKLSEIVEGKSTLLVEDGQIRWDALREHHLGERDLHIAVRQALNTNDFSRAKDIYLEPNGKFSVVEKSA